MVIFGRGFVRRSRAAATPILLALLSLIIPVTSAAASPEQSAIMAVGDVHGDFDDLVLILQRSGLLDAQLHWTGNDATLVQTGDLLDRGPKPREVMDFLMSLQKEAAKKGGHVVVLLGNHEVMNIMGDLRYVTAGNYASFAEKDSEKRRHSAYQQYAEWRKNHAALLQTVPQMFSASTEEEWQAQHPAGFIEQREAFSPEGKYGKWLRERPAVADINNMIFLHGGLDPSVSSLKLDEINKRIREEIASFDAAKKFMVSQRLVLPFFSLQEITAVVQAELQSRQNAPGTRHPNLTNPGDTLPEHTQLQILNNFAGYGHWLSVAGNGPLWFRGYDQWTDEQGAAEVPHLLAAYHASRIVVGHTPQKDGRIRARFGGTVFLIDTGMLSSYYPQGRASALEISGNSKFTAEYMDRKDVLFDRTATVPSASPAAAGSGATAQPHR
jgi:Calcineurin-like phosphoesterase